MWIIILLSVILLWLASENFRTRTENSQCVQCVQSTKGVIGGGLLGSQPAPAQPRMSFRYPYTSPWEFYQSPWIMYQRPWEMSKSDYERNSVPNYYSKMNWTEMKM